MNDEPDFKSPDPFSDSIVQPDQSLQENSSVDQRKHFKSDFTGPLHWFPAAADLIARLSQKLEGGLDV